MRHFQRVFLLCFCGSILFSCAKGQTIQPASLGKLYGFWKGSLTYLDYSSGKPFTMAAELAVYTIPGGLVIQTSYPDEPQANGADTLHIKNGDTSFMGSRITAFAADSAGNFELTTQYHGPDGNDQKPALIRKKYTVKNNRYTLQKEVLFDGTSDWIIRHTYRFSRSVNTNIKDFSGKWTIDLRPSIDAAPYLKQITLTVNGKELSGIFYDTPFTGGLINTEWNRISFAFSTSDQSGEYYHSGYFQDGKITGFSFSKARGFVIPWFSVKKEKAQ